MAQLQKPATTPERAEANQPIGNFRWVICGLLFFATAINYIDRQILGILKPQLSHDLQWNEQDYANIVTAFQLTYAFGYLFGGRLMDRFGVKRGLPLAALVWSIFAAMHGLMRSVVGFSIARLGLGLSEGGDLSGGDQDRQRVVPTERARPCHGHFQQRQQHRRDHLPPDCPLSGPEVRLARRLHHHRRAGNRLGGRLDTCL